jgi:ABC-type xylose transport system permease subunit
MVLISYLLGRRYYPVPYELARVLGYVLLGLALYGVNRLLIATAKLPSFATGTACLLAFLALTWLADGRRLARRAGGE